MSKLFTALTTKGLIRVDQTEAYGDIRVSLAAGGQHVASFDEGDEGEEDDEDEDGGEEGDTEDNEDE